MDYDDIAVQSPVMRACTAVAMVTRQQQQQQQRRRRRHRADSQDQAMSPGTNQPGTPTLNNNNHHQFNINYQRT